MTDGKDNEAFLSRWSRLKDQAREHPPEEASSKAPAGQTPAPELPPVEKLTLDSDFRGFFHPKVDEGLRRTALKKLFSDPHFNVMDGLDVYIDDYSKNDPIPPEMLAGLRQAQNILKWAKEDEEERKRIEAERQAAAGKQPAALEEKLSPAAAQVPGGEQRAASETSAPDAPPRGSTT